MCEVSSNYVSFIDKPISCSSHDQMITDPILADTHGYNITEICCTAYHQKSPINKNGMDIIRNKLNNKLKNIVSCRYSSVGKCNLSRVDV